MTERTPLTGFALALRDFALALPETTEDFPWGERALKVRGKTFVFLRDEEGLSFSVKLPTSGAGVLRRPFAAPTHYGLGKHGWVTIVVPKRTSASLREECLMWVRESYVAVAPAKLARAVQAG